MFVRHIKSVTRNAPRIRIIHQLLVISAFSARLSILTHEMISSGRPTPMIFLHELICRYVFRFPYNRRKKQILLSVQLPGHNTAGKFVHNMRQVELLSVIRIFRHSIFKLQMHGLLYWDLLPSSILTYDKCAPEPFTKGRLCVQWRRHSRWATPLLPNPFLMRFWASINQSGSSRLLQTHCYRMSWPAGTKSMTFCPESVRYTVLVWYLWDQMVGLWNTILKQAPAAQFELRANSFY